MAGWIVQARSGVRTGLTPYQVQQLVRTGEVEAGTPARLDGSTAGEWQRVEDVPGVDRQLRLMRTAPEAVKALDDATVDAMVSSLADERYRQSLRRLVLGARIGAALLLALEVAYFASYLVG